MSGNIVPRKLAKGVDICGTSDCCYIIRSDLGCYMKSYDFHKALNVAVYSLHSACSWGDHYLADADGHFYIIKGDTYRRVTDLTTDADASIYTLHTNCRGGDHYLAVSGSFYIIYQSRGVYRKTSNLDKDENGVDYTLHEDFINGLYYFGVHEWCYFVKPLDEWGVQYHCSTNFDVTLTRFTYSFHPTIVNFLPGGFGYPKGAACGEWVCLKTIVNDSQTTVKWKNVIIKKTGYEKEKMSSLEHNWNVAANVTAETGDLTRLIGKAQFSLSTDYGGAKVNTDTEIWSKATEIQESLDVTLAPKQKIYLWTYRLCLGKVPILYRRDMTALETSTPPTDVPLPPATN